MKHIIIILSGVFFLIISNQVNAQGCIAIRTTGGSLCTMQHPEDGSTPKNDAWQLNIGDRYFKSFRHFIGTTEQKQRQKEQTEVINHVNTLNISVARNINSRLSISVGSPILANAPFAKISFWQRGSFFNTFFWYRRYEYCIVSLDARSKRCT